jgi:hypothetical protein
LISFIQQVTAMTAILLTDRYDERLQGVLNCYDRIVITGTLPGVCFAQGMTAFLNSEHIRIFDYPRFAEPLRERIRSQAQVLADQYGVRIESVAKAHVRKEDLVANVLAERGDQPGLVHILSAMETCPSYAPWHHKQTHQTFLRPTQGKCLHYYFYFMDAEVGLCYLRVPTWCPFKLQFYCNGHSWLARRLAAAGIEAVMADNCFIRIDDFAHAQGLADTLKPDELHRILDRYAALCCPVLDVFAQRYHWSLMQVEYSTDLVFRSPTILESLYASLAREAVLAVKADQVSTFLGKKLTPQVAQEIGSRLATRIEGTCIKHRMGSVSIKLYDKAGRVLRLETTANDVTFFQHHRKVEQRDGTTVRKLAPVKKSIYSLIDLRDIFLGCNRRYLEFLSALDDHSSGRRDLQRLTEPKLTPQQTFKGFNFFDPTEQALLCALQRPEFNVHGLRRADLQMSLPGKSPAFLSRQLRRLREFRLIKRVTGTYRYYLTRLGRSTIAMCCNLTEFMIIPTLAQTSV